MSFILKEELLQSQDVWKRSQIRLTPSLYNAVLGYASEHELSLNSALMYLTDKGLTLSTQTDESIINTLKDKNDLLTIELIALSTENRELRRLYIEAINSNFDKIPDNLKSAYGKIVKEILTNNEKPAI